MSDGPPVTPQPEPAPDAPDAPVPFVAPVEAACADASTPAPADAAAPTVTATASPPWTPPETFADRFSRWSVRAVRGAVATFGLLSLVCFVLWVIPTVAVARSDAYRLACERVSNDPMLQQYAGTPIVCARVPTWYDVRAADDQRFKLEATCPGGKIVASVRVQAGKAHLGETFLSSFGD